MEFVIAAVAAGYQLVALAACVWFRFRSAVVTGYRPPVSILKPVRGLDPGFEDALRSHAEQEYPEFEVLVGVADPADPAVAVVQRVAAAFPGVSIRVVPCTTEAPNAKVGVLMDLEREARFDVLLVNDADIRVPRRYLETVVAPLADGDVGVVTCAYRAESRGWPGKFEALGIVTDFFPSVLVAPWAGVREFGLGSTLVFRRADLESVNGFESLKRYLADDYQLAKRISSTGKRVELSKCVVATELEGSWCGIWQHQVRWHRTIRVSRGAYVGMPVTNGTLWTLVLCGLGSFGLAGAVLALRLVMALAAAWVSGSGLGVRYAWLVPLRDIWGFGVWVAGLVGREVVWRGRRLRVDDEGRIDTDRVV